MSRSTTSLLLNSALAGLAAGALVACGGDPSPAPVAAAPAAAHTDPAPAEVAHGDATEAGEMHMEGGDQGGTIAVHDCRGQNDCSGQGGCGVEGQNSCRGQNPCSGKGGCKTS